jgi:hypothetical protein
MSHNSPKYLYFIDAEDEFGDAFTYLGVGRNQFDVMGQFVSEYESAYERPFVGEFEALCVRELSGFRISLEAVHE